MIQSNEWEGGNWSSNFVLTALESLKQKSSVALTTELCTPYGNRTRVSSVKGMRPNP